MQSHSRNRDLGRVYYVDLDGYGVLAVPAERLLEMGRLRTEQRRRQVDASMTLSFVRRG